MTTRDINRPLSQDFLHDFEDFGHLLEYMKKPGFGDVQDWNKEIATAEELRSSVLEFMRWQSVSNLNDESRVQVAVVGDFSAGKSSVINSLLGESICPVKVEPSTSSITTFRYGDREKFLIVAQEGQDDKSWADLPKEISRHEYVRMVGHQGAMGMRFHFEVQYPFSGLYDIELIDTPGFANASNSDDERITLDKCKEADVLFFVLDANRGNVGADMKRRLLQIKKSSPQLRIYVILNKADQKGSQILEELCVDLREDNLFSDAVAYSSKQEMRQFEECNTGLADFSSILLSSKHALIVRHESEQIFYKPVAINPSHARQVIMAWLDAIQQEKEAFHQQGRIRSVIKYKRQTKKWLQTIQKKIKEAYQAQDEKDSTGLRYRLLSIIDVDKTFEQIGNVVAQAAIESMSKHEVTRSAKFYVLDPFFRIKFNAYKFATFIANSKEYHSMAARIVKLMEAIPLEYIEHIKESFESLSWAMEHISNVFSSITYKINVALEKVDSNIFEDEKAANFFKYDWMPIARSDGIELFKKKVYVYIEKIIDDVEKCIIYENGSGNEKNAQVVSFLNRTHAFSEYLELRAVSKKQGISLNSSLESVGVM